MQRILLVIAASGSTAAAFAPQHHPALSNRALRPSASARLRMAGDADLVKVEEETIKTSTAIVGGAAGFLFGGPVCSAIPPSSAILPS